MSDLNNPYQSPAAETEIVKPLVRQGTLTENMLKYLSGASPWLRFVGIVEFIGAGTFFLIGLFMLFVLMFSASLLEEASGVLFYFLLNAGPAMFGYFVYLFGFGALWFFQGFFSYRFGAKIRAYIQTNSEQELELVFKSNKSLWKFIGFYMIILIAVVPVFIIVGIIAVVASFALGQ